MRSSTRKHSLLIQPNHPDLLSKLVPGYDFVGGDQVVQDGNGHGMHVSGIAAAVT